MEVLRGQGGFGGGERDTGGDRGAVDDAVQRRLRAGLRREVQVVGVGVEGQAQRAEPAAAVGIGLPRQHRVQAVAGEQRRVHAVALPVVPGLAEVQAELPVRVGRQPGHDHLRIAGAVVHGGHPGVLRQREPNRPRAQGRIRLERVDGRRRIPAGLSGLGGASGVGGILRQRRLSRARRVLGVARVPRTSGVPGLRRILRMGGIPRRRGVRRVGGIRRPGRVRRASGIGRIASIAGVAGAAGAAGAAGVAGVARAAGVAGVAGVAGAARAARAAGFGGVGGRCGLPRRHGPARPDGMRRSEGGVIASTAQAAGHHAERPRRDQPRAGPDPADDGAAVVVGRRAGCHLGPRSASDGGVLGVDVGVGRRRRVGGGSGAVGDRRVGRRVRCRRGRRPPFIAVGRGGHPLICRTSGASGPRHGGASSWRQGRGRRLRRRREYGRGGHRGRGDRQGAGIGHGQRGFTKEARSVPGRNRPIDDRKRREIGGP